MRRVCPRDHAHRSTFFILILSIAAVAVLDTASFAQAPTPASQLTTLIDQLTKSLNNDAAKDSQKADARAALNNLLETIAKIPCDASDDANLACKVQEFSRLVGKLGVPNPGSQLTADQQKALWDAATPVLSGSVKDQDTTFIAALDLLAKVLNGLGTLHDSKAALEKLDSIIPSITTRIHPPPQADKKSVADTAAKLTKDVAALVTAVTGGPVKQWIRIDGAWFGHLGAIRGSILRNTDKALSPWAQGTRFCSATRAIRARCQAQEQCFAPTSSSSTGGAGGNTTEITGTNLCGYEPAPFAAPSSRGLIIRYRCLSSADDEWSSFAKHDDDVVPVKPPTTKSSTGDAQLRASTIALIRCPPPEAPSATGSPSAGTGGGGGGGGGATPLAVTVPPTINVTIQAPK